jgi:hypothetical protein
MSSNFGSAVSRFSSDWLRNSLNGTVVFLPHLVESQASHQPDYKEASTQDPVGYSLFGLEQTDLDEIVGPQEQQYS